MTELVDEVRTVTEQLEPERARSCRNAIATASVMVDEIRLPDCTPGVPDRGSNRRPIGLGRGRLTHSPQGEW